MYGYNNSFSSFTTLYLPTQKKSANFLSKSWRTILLKFYLDYQMLTRFSGATYIGDSGVILNASYQAAMCGRAPFTRYLPNE